MGAAVQQTGRTPFMKTGTPPCVYGRACRKASGEPRKCHHSDLRAITRGEFFTSLFTSVFNFFWCALFLSTGNPAKKLTSCHLQITRFCAECCTGLTTDPAADSCPTLVLEYSGTPSCDPTISPASPPQDAKWD